MCRVVMMINTDFSVIRTLWFAPDPSYTKVQQQCNTLSVGYTESGDRPRIARKDVGEERGGTYLGSVSSAGGFMDCSRSLQLTLELHAFVTDVDTLGNVAALVGGNQHLFFASVCRSWRVAWRQRHRSTLTAIVRPDSSVSQLLYSFECGARTTAGVCEAAARAGNLQVLQCARRIGCPWHTKTWGKAARGGHLDVLVWAQENGCPKDDDTCLEAARGGHLHILQWARTYGCPWARDTVVPVSVGSIEHSNNYVSHTWDTCSVSAEAGHLHILKWAKENGCPWDSKTCSGAATGGHLNVLQWARENGCEWDSTTCFRAAEGGFLETLQWARLNGCPWDAMTCLGAADGGHLEILRYARENGCPLHAKTWRTAALQGHLHVLLWGLENSYPMGDDSSLEALMGGSVP